MDAIDVEARIAALLSRGEREAARALLVASYDAPVTALCRGLVRDPRLAEDLKQDAFVRALTHLDEHRGEGPLRAWVMRIARNGCLDHLRRKSPVALDVLDPEGAPDLDAGDVAAVLADLQRAELALAALDPEDRALVLLHHVEGVDYAELASTFGASQGALRMRMQRALAKMRTELERAERGRVRHHGIPRFALWASLTLLVCGLVGVGTYIGAVQPARQRADLLSAELAEMHAAAERAQADAERVRDEMAAARGRSASEEELTRLRRRHDAAQGELQTAALEGHATVMRSSTARTSASTSMRSTQWGSPVGTCNGPLCGLMRTTTATSARDAGVPDSGAPPNP